VARQLPIPTVLFDPEASAHARRGFDTLAELLARTLGPTQGRILFASDARAEHELLADAATIARRFLALPNRAEDVGAMMLRHLVWRVHERAGDGGATAAVLAQALLAGAQRYLAAGVDATALRKGMHAAIAAALDALAAQSRPLESAADLYHLALTATGEEQISCLLAEIFDLLGSDAHVTIEDYVAPYFEREYAQGGAWQARLLSPALLTSQVLQRAVQHDVAVALFDGDLATVADVQPLLETLLRHDRRRLLLVANTISGEALATLLLNHQRGQLRIIACELHTAGQQRADDWADLAAFTGARLRSSVWGERLDRFALQDLGQSWRVEASGTTLRVMVRADQPTRSAQRELVRAQATGEQPGVDVQALRKRIARLAGAEATLKLGATSKQERALLRQHAATGIAVLHGALRHGVVLGGGAAFWGCVPAVRALQLPGEQVYGGDVVARAIEAPLRRIIANSGRHDPQVLLHEIGRRGAGFGYDARSQEIVPMEAAGILDSAEVLRVALQAAASGAATLLSTNTIVLKRRPNVSFEP
jgi:chaperonin GroEL